MRTETNKLPISKVFSSLILVRRPLKCGKLLTFGWFPKFLHLVRKMCKLFSGIEGTSLNASTASSGVTHVTCVTCVTHVTCVTCVTHVTCATHVTFVQCQFRRSDLLNELIRGLPITFKWFCTTRLA